MVAVACLASCSPQSGDVFTLYRNSPTDEFMRLQIATFDATEPGNYNQENCEITRSLFAAQPGIVVRYWCEKGRFKK